MWNSFASLGSLVVPGLPEALPGLSQPQDDDNPSSAKKLKISGPLEDFSLPPDMTRVFALEAARLQAMQAEILPYQPVAVVSQTPGLCLPELENDRRIYVPSLSQSLTRRDIFTHFCAFGGLERVCVKNGLDSLNYAIVLFVRAASMQLAIAANPHSIKGHRLVCRKAAEKNSNKDIRQFVPTKPVRTDLEENPVPRTLATNPPEKILEKNPGKPDVKELVEPKNPLGVTPERLESSKNLKNSKKSESSRNGDQRFVYAVTTLKYASRWSFNLARSFTTLEEKEALKDGHPSAAIKLLKASTHKSPHKSRHSLTRAKNFIKPTTPLKTEGIRKNPSWIPASIPNTARFPVSLPPPSPKHSLSSTEDRILISKPGPTPVRSPKHKNSISKADPAPSALQPLNNLVLHMPDLNMISDNSYFSPDCRYEHHCYTNVVAYQKTKLYIDLEPGDWEKRQTIKEFIDAKYGAGITKH